jgi:hypothetical protein
MLELRHWKFSKVILLVHVSHFLFDQLVHLVFEFGVGVHLLIDVRQGSHQVRELVLEHQVVLMRLILYHQGVTPGSGGLTHFVYYYNIDKMK